MVIKKMLIDSHVHLLDPRLSSRKEEVIKKLKSDGIECVVEMSASPVESREALAFACAYENVYCAVGVHPSLADDYSEEFEAWVISQKGNKKIVAIGECGLDYYHLECPAKMQHDIFAAQIKLAERMGLPLVVHTRDAFEDTAKILNKHRSCLNNGLLIHCFSGGAEEVELFKKLDAYFAFGGAVTYKNAGRSAEAIRAVPRDRLIIETDCPYLAPVPLRGTVNEPKNVKIVAEYIAGILGLTFDEFARLTTENTKKFYRL